MLNSDHDEPCPWNTVPKTLEELVEASLLQEKWEEKTGQKAPWHWNIVATRQMFTQIVSRLIDVEKIVGDKVLLAPVCECGKSKEANLVNVTAMGDTQQRWLVTWVCFCRKEDREQ